ncbi:MAG: hypothetical protein JXR03_18770 [Cyclobacteriaceae bacterium]
MYKIEKKPFGYHLQFSGLIKEEEMKKWYEESLEVLQFPVPGFGVLADLRTMSVLPPASQSVMEKGQRHYKQKGMVRSVVILNSAITTMQFRKIGKKSGIYEWERYIDASSNPDWESKAIKWIENEIDPDKG